MRRSGVKQQHHQNDRNAIHGLQQSVAQLKQVLDEGLFGTGQFIFFFDRIGHQLTLEGRYRATRAAPDKALVRVPVRALYQRGVAPCLTRHFSLGCLYSGKPGVSRYSALGTRALVSAQLFSKSAALVWIEFSTSRAALSTVSFIFLNSSSSMERLTSSLTSATYRRARPSKVPMVFASPGSLSGPITTSAMPPMMASLVIPISITVLYPQIQAKRHQTLVLASTSMVSLAALAPVATCWVTTGAAAVASAAFSFPSFMPSLKPLTAPPKSAPMLRSFLVPKITMMMTKKMIRGVVENPMNLS